MWQYFNLPLKGHIRQIWLYLVHCNHSIQRVKDWHVFKLFSVFIFKNFEDIILDFRSAILIFSKYIFNRVPVLKWVLWWWPSLIFFIKVVENHLRNILTISQFNLQRRCEISSNQTTLLALLNLQSAS